MRSLVTGGGGFLGGAIVRRLVEHGDEVRTLQRGVYPELDAPRCRVRPGRHRRSRRSSIAPWPDATGSFTSPPRSRCGGRESPFASPTSWGPRTSLHAMRRHGVAPACLHEFAERCPRRRQTSKAPTNRCRIRITSRRPIPRPKPKPNDWCSPRMIPICSTMSLRPHLIWGPADTTLVPIIVDRARAGQLRLVGDGSNLIDTVYIDNAVDAHLLAAERLASGFAGCAGRAYFITNDDPRPIRRDHQRLCRPRPGSRPSRRRFRWGWPLPRGGFSKPFTGSFRSPAGPRMTPFLARHLATAHWYDISAAKTGPRVRRRRRDR